MSWFAADTAVTAGLALTRESAVLATSYVDGNGEVQRTIRHAALGFRLFEADPTPDAGAHLTAIFTELRKELPDGALPVQISLPDPAVSLQLFELDAWPVRQSEREALVRWRFAKTLALDGERLACTWQSLGRCQDKHLVLATATERGRLDLILSACREAGIAPTIADMNANYYFNGFYDRWAAGEDGALLIVEPASWALMLWDAGRRPRFLRSRWRDASGAADYDSIIADIEWQIRAYVHAAPGRRIARVMIGGGECVAFMNHLGSTPRFPCMPLDAAERLEGRKPPASPVHGEASAAWLASLPR